MLLRKLLIFTALAALADPAPADEVRYCQENGVTYLETRRVVQRLVPETKMQASTQTCYREQVTTETRDTTRCWWCPVTEYRCEQEMVGRWNPFVTPYTVNKWVPQTRWEQRTEAVKMPVVTRRLVPETHTVQVPVTTYRTVQEEAVSRVPVAVAAQPPAGGLSQFSPGANGTVPFRSASAANPSPTMARRDPVGGISRLDQQDPPRYGLDSGWQPAP